MIKNYGRRPIDLRKLSNGTRFYIENTGQTGTIVEVYGVKSIYTESGIKPINKSYKPNDLQITIIN